MATVMNACVGSWECGKSRAFPTFPQPLFLFFWREFPEKFTIQRGEGGASSSHGEGLMYVFRNHSSDQRSMNLISIKDGININFDIFLGVDDEEVEYRVDSLDGTRICYNLIYKRLEEIRSSETTVNYNEYQTQSSEIVEHNTIKAGSTCKKNN